MGYTHYFEFKSVPKGQAKQVELAYIKAVKECAKLARTWNAEHPKGGIDDADRLSGFSAHDRSAFYAGLQVNGKGDNAHESFDLREHFKQNLENGGFNFCKTARKPYDTVVTACLAVLKYRLGTLIEVSSDGDASDWDAGTEFASRVLRRSIPNPLHKGLRLVKGRKAA